MYTQRTLISMRALISALCGMLVIAVLWEAFIKSNQMRRHIRACVKKQPCTVLCRHTSSTKAALTSLPWPPHREMHQAVRKAAGPRAQRDPPPPSAPGVLPGVTSRDSTLALHWLGRFRVKIQILSGCISICNGCQKQKN